MNQVRVGDVVFHYRDPKAEPAPAMVTAVGTSNRLALSIFYPGMYNLNVLDGVPPLCEHGVRPIDEEVGYWGPRDAVVTVSDKQPAKAGK